MLCVDSSRLCMSGLSLCDLCLCYSIFGSQFSNKYLLTYLLTYYIAHTFRKNMRETIGKVALQTTMDQLARFVVHLQ